MSLAPGTKLGPYEIVSPLGAGGMGEVYRAKDSKLKREVAIKVLPPDVANDRERLARFQREAEVLASLNHPHIAHIYGIEENALIMELVEGEDLSQRIARGPIPLDEALPIARQIAEALEAAHEQGIIHRDLKPANIKVRPDGTVKVLDFGLAKALDPLSGLGAPGSGNFANSPTITSPAMTMHGMILGTAAFMSPEQAKGKAVDKRADIWAFGCVLYEMVTGNKAFDGEDGTEILGAIIKSEPDWQRLPASTPVVIRKLLKRCLTKNVKDRLDSARIARLEIADALIADDTSPVRTPRQPSRTGWIVAAIAALVAAATLVYAAFVSRELDQKQEVRFAITLQPPPTTQIAVSPNGRYIAYLETGGALMLRAIDATTPVALPGTQGATAIFWSPDSRFIAFSGGDRLLKVDIAGGPPEQLGEAASVRGATSGAWAPDGTVLITSVSAGSSALMKLSASGGGAPVRVPGPPGSVAMFSPSFLPDGGHFLIGSRGRNPEESGVYVSDLAGHDHKKLFGDLSKAIYSAGHILFVREGSLMARRFDTARLEFTEEAFRVADGVNWNPVSGRVAMDASSGGTLAYRSEVRTAIDEYQLTWVDRTGKPLSTVGGIGQPTGVALSPDGKAIATHLHQRNGGDLWIMDANGRGLMRFTFDDTQDSGAPLWSPDGKSIAYTARRASQSHILVKPIDGSTAERLVSASADATISPMSWTPDGQAIIFMRSDPATGWNLWRVGAGGGDAEPLEARPFREGFAQVSPNGKWLAYSSNESRTTQVFVRSYPAGPVKRQVSETPGTYPRWRADGNELFFLSETGTMMSAEVRQADGAPEFSAPQELFRATSWTGPISGHTGNYHPFAVSADGRRFLLPLAKNSQTVPSPEPSIIVIVNWASRFIQ